MDRVRILTGVQQSNGDKPYVLLCAVGEGSNAIGEFAILFECSGKIRVETIQSKIYSSEDVVVDQLKAAVLNQLESYWLHSSPSSGESDNSQNSCVSLVEQKNAYLSLVELCSITNGLERLKIISENTNSEQLKKLISCAAQDANEN